MITSTIIITTRIIAMAESTRFDYIHDPVAIEEESFRRIRQVTSLVHLNRDEQQIAMRLVHTCGDPALMNDLVFHGEVVKNGLEALRNSQPILTDVEMVRHGITRRFISSEVRCFLNAEGVAERAKTTGETRSMAAVESWRPLLAGSIVVIGNAPTALFRLLEMLHAGADKPALIIGMPVGFVGAAESKEALLQSAQELNLAAITLRGYRGGSALAASVINALGRMNQGVYL